MNEVRSSLSTEPTKSTGDGMDSSAVTKKLEEELKKRDALIEVCSPTFHVGDACL